MEEEIQMDPKIAEALVKQAEEDFLIGATCNCYAPEDCEPCQ